MSDLLDAARAVAALAREPIPTFNRLPAPPDAFTTDPRFADLLRPASAATEEERNEALRILAPAIAGGDPYQCSRIAITGGTTVEYGANASLLAPTLVDALPRHLGLAAGIVGDVDEGKPLRGLFDSAPDAVRAWHGLDFLLYAAMTALCRDVPSRIRARANGDIVDALPPLEDHFAPAGFLSQLLSFTDDMILLVLHPGERKGWRVRLTAVATNFHLFTLLQARLVGPNSDGKLQGEPTDPDVAAVARGEVPLTRQMHDHARFQFYDGRAIGADGSLARDIGNWIWGEGVPGDIPVVGGERVVVLGPMALASRGWDAGFFANIHDALRSDAEIIETLTDAQVTKAMEKLGA